MCIIEPLIGITASEAGSNHNYDLPGFPSQQRRRDGRQLTEKMPHQKAPRT
jgi:hypothetical protein